MDADDLKKLTTESLQELADLLEQRSKPAQIGPRIVNGR